MKKQFALTVIAASIAASPVASATNGYFTHGYGTSHKGMAGAGVAISEDLMSAATNPAALNLDYLNGKTGIIVGAELFSPDREYRISQPDFYAPEGFYLQSPGKESDNSVFLIPEFAIGKKLNEKWGAGLVVYANGGMNTEYAAPTTEQGTFYAGKTGVDLKQLFISPTFSYKVSESTQVGFAPLLVVQQFKATGLASFGGFSSSPENLSNQGTDTTTGFGLQVGIQHQISEPLRVGFSYRSSVSMDEFDKYAGLFAEQGGFDLPSSLQVGVAWQASAEHQFLVDWQKINYGEVNSIANPLSNLMVAPLGADNGAGFGWEDMSVVKFGWQWQRTAEQKLRLGVSYGEQPIPSTQTLFNILAPGVQEWHYTAGLTQLVGDNTKLSVMAFYSPSKSVKGSNMLAPNQDITLEMSQMGFAASLEWAF